MSSSNFLLYHHVANNVLLFTWELRLPLPTIIEVTGYCLLRCSVDFNKSFFDMICNLSFLSQPFPRIILNSSDQIMFPTSQSWNVIKEVFLSPKIIQLILDLRAQRSLSCSSTTSNFLINWFSSATREADDWLAKALCTPSSQAKTLFFFWKIFPKWFLFHKLACLENTSIASRSFLGCYHACFTTLGKDGLDNQKDWNLKGLVRCNYLLGLVSNNTGQWSEWHLIKFDTLASG